MLHQKRQRSGNKGEEQRIIEKGGTEMNDEITSVMINPLNGFGNLKAIASLNFRGVILKGLRLLDTDGKLWLGMARKKKNENWEDVYFFPDKSIKETVLEAIVKQYNLALGN